MSDYPTIKSISININNQAENVKNWYKNSNNKEKSFIRIGKMCAFAIKTKQ